MTSLTHKQGQSLGWTVNYTPETGWPVNLSGVTITSTFIDSQGVSRTMTVVKNINNVDFTVSASTALWSIGVGNIDFKLTSGGSTWYTETVAINVVKHITS
jgi:hypothetical protein